MTKIVYIAAHCTRVPEKHWEHTKVMVLLVSFKCYMQHNKTDNATHSLKTEFPPLPSNSNPNNRAALVEFS